MFGSTLRRDRMTNEINSTGNEAAYLLDEKTTIAKIELSRTNCKNGKDTRTMAGDHHKLGNRS